jgi:hypothetical protein
MSATSLIEVLSRYSFEDTRRSTFYFLAPPKRMILATSYAGNRGSLKPKLVIYFEICYRNYKDL